MLDTHPLPHHHSPHAMIFSTASSAKKAAKAMSVPSRAARKADPSFTPWLSMASRTQFTYRQASK